MIKNMPEECIEAILDALSMIVVRNGEIIAANGAPRVCLSALVVLDHIPVRGYGCDIVKRMVSVPLW